MGFSLGKVLMACFGVSACGVNGFGGLRSAFVPRMERDAERRGTGEMELAFFWFFSPFRWAAVGF